MVSDQLTNSSLELDRAHHANLEAEITQRPQRVLGVDRARLPYARSAAISRHFERDPIPYALETDWPVGAAGFEPLHLEIRSAVFIRRMPPWRIGRPVAECRYG